MKRLLVLLTVAILGVYLVSALAQETPDVDSELESIAKHITGTCPIKVDSNTNVVKVDYVAQSRNLIFYHELQWHNTEDGFLLQTYRAMLLEHIEQRIKSKELAGIRKRIRTHGLTVVYVYKDLDNKMVMKIIVDQAGLNRLEVKYCEEIQWFKAESTI